MAISFDRALTQERCREVRENGVTSITNFKGRLSDAPKMETSELFIAAGILGALAGAALRFGPSDALEGLFLLTALAGMKIARACLRGVLVVLRLMMGIR